LDLIINTDGDFGEFLGRNLMLNRLFNFRANCFPLPPADTHASKFLDLIRPRIAATRKHFVGVVPGGSLPINDRKMESPA
jgi:hypothetical protein